MKGTDHGEVRVECAELRIDLAIDGILALRMVVEAHSTGASARHDDVAASARCAGTGEVDVEQSVKCMFVCGLHAGYTG